MVDVFMGVNVFVIECIFIVRFSIFFVWWVVDSKIFKGRKSEGCLVNEIFLLLKVRKEKNNVKYE